MLLPKHTKDDSIQFLYWSARVSFLKVLSRLSHFFHIVFVFLVNKEYIESHKKNKDKFYINYYLQKKERFLLCNHIYYYNRKWRKQLFDYFQY